MDFARSGSVGKRVKIEVHFTEMDTINFKPWIGENYGTTGFKGKKILVLGESHYCKEELSEGGRCFPSCTKAKMRVACHNETINCISDFVETHKNFKQYRNFEKTIYGRALTDEESAEFWNGIVFYNYVQYSVGNAPRVCVPEKYWEKSEEAFKEVLEKFMPDYILIWGVSRLWQNLPNWGGRESQVEIDGERLKVWIYTINGKEIPAMACYHPSTKDGSDYEYWHPFYKKFLNLPQL
jgi:hypothetical protein